MDHVDAGYARAIELDPCYDRIREHVQVRSRPTRHQVGNRGAIPHPLKIVRRNRSYAARIWRVQVGTVCKAELAAGFIKRLAWRQPVLARCSRDRDWTTVAVPQLIAEGGIVLNLAVIRKTIVVRPVGIAC